MAKQIASYPASLNIDYPKQLDRFTTFMRILWVIPVLIVLVMLTSAGGGSFTHESSKGFTRSGGGLAGGMFAATALMIVFRQRYPRWWFDFALELNRFSTRVGAYLFLLTDRYPSTIDKQAVHLEVKYPDAKRDLDRWLPLVKWLLAIPHYVILVLLAVAVLGASIISWFAILFTGNYPKSLFDFVVGVGRWQLRVSAYAFLLVTDEYPPFSLK